MQDKYISRAGLIALRNKIKSLLSQKANTKEAVYNFTVISGKLGQNLANKLTTNGMVAAGNFYNITDISFPLLGTGTRGFIAHRASGYIRVEAFSYTANSVCMAVYDVNTKTWSTPVSYVLT